MKKWMQSLSAVLKMQGFDSQKIKSGLSATEWQEVAVAFEQAYGKSLEAMKAENEDVEESAGLSNEEIAGVAAFLDNEEKAAAEKAALQERIRQIEAEKAAIAAEPENDAPIEKAKAKVVNAGFGSRHTKDYAFGIESPLYSAQKWYNQLLIDSEHKVVAVRSQERKVFCKDFVEATQQLRSRMAQHQANGTFGKLTMDAASAGISYGDMENVLGDYVVRRQDAVIAYLKSLPSVEKLFPVHSNVQNKEAVVSAIIGEMSQGYRKGRTFKGGVQFKGEVYKVDDVMFKFNFEDLTELEKQYIGYLNTEHSAVIKWSFIEWVIIYCGEQLIREQSERRVVGCRVPQQNVSSNPANLAADGVITAIQKAVIDNRVLPFSDINAYTSSTMLDTVEAFADKVQEVAEDADKMKIYLNAKHKRWYIRAYREKYGQDADFTGAHATLADLSPEMIVWVPNMSNADYLMWATYEGNIELLEDKPGEMLDFDFDKELEGVVVTSRWKEGAHVIKSGAVKTAAQAAAGDYSNQFLFCNWPFVDVEVDTSIDLSTGINFTLTNGDDESNEITTVTGLKADRVYSINTGACPLDKAGAFSKISDDVPAGYIIRVYAELEDSETTIDGETVTITVPTGKVLELDRVSVA